MENLSSTVKKWSLPSRENPLSLTTTLLAQKRQELPIDEKRETILEAIRNHDELIITAETGAGKSTRVPQFLAEEGYKVIVTQPRVLAAMSLADRVAEEMGGVLGEEVGYHVGGQTQNARNFSPTTKIKFCTDGLQLVKQLMDKSIITSDKNTVLVIDEVHEWNQNIEVLVAWTKKLKKLGIKMKVILMSATIDKENLATYYASADENLTGDALNLQPQVIEVPGRTYPVERSQEAEWEMIDKVVEFVKEKRNVLVFQPGKKEISETIATLQRKLPENETVILPLHGELTPEEQKQIFKRYTKPVVIVATNIAQTSLTIPYIDAVVDSGKERRVEMREGVETLVLWDISQADSMQRGGRAGRTKAWIYVLCNDTPFHQLPNYSKPEIQRTLLDHNYLRILSTTGLKMEELEFFHQPSKELIEKAKNTLKILGAIDDQNQVTPLGKQLAKLPVDVNTGRMIIESLKYGVTDDILKIAAIKQVDGIIARNATLSYEVRDEDSDLLTQLKLYGAGKRIQESKEPFAKKEERFQDAGIFRKKYFKAVEQYRNLKDIMYSYIREQNSVPSLSPQEKKEALLKCITAWMLDSLYKREDGEYVDRNRDERQKGKESTTDAHSLISAEPKNIQFTNRRGRLDQINIVTNVSKAKPEWLEELAPHLIAKKKNADKWDNTTQQVVYQEDTHFNGLHIASKDLESPLSSQGILQFCNALARGYVEKDQEKLRYIYEHNQKVREEISQLRNRFPGIRELSYSDLSDYYWEVIHNSGIQSTKALQQYLETHGIEIFLLNEPKFLIRNYDKLPQWYPEEIQVKDQKYRVKYNLGWYGDFSIKIQIPLQDLDQLSQKDFSPELFRKQPYSFTILDEKGDSLTSVSDLDVYKEKIKAERLQKKRNDFEKSYTSQLQSKDFASRDGQREVQEKLFDAETERFAYLGILARNYEDTFEEKWFLEKNEAQDATQKTQEKYQAYVQKQQDISRFEVVYQEVQTLYQGIDKKLNEDRDWGTTWYCREIIDGMNKVRDYLQYDSNKDINEIENFKATLQSVDAALSNARQFLVEYDEISTELDKIDWENIAPEIEKSHWEDVTLLRKYSLDQKRYSILGEHGEYYEIELFHTLDELPGIKTRLHRIKKLIEEREKTITNSDDLATLLASKFLVSQQKKKKY